MQDNKTCANCKRKNETSQYRQCMECLANDTQTNRFPNWEPMTEKQKCDNLKIGLKRI